ncbi:MAG: hypothetical protein V4488_01880 [Pseudomonadota bacterium]
MKKIAIASLMVLASDVGLAQTAEQLQQVRDAMVKTNRDICLNFERYRKSDVAQNPQTLSTYCQCTARTYVDSISDEEFREMAKHPFADKAEQVAIQAKFSKIELQCRKSLGK